MRQGKGRVSWVERQTGTIRSLHPPPPDQKKKEKEVKIRESRAKIKEEEQREKKNFNAVLEVSDRIIPEVWESPLSCTQLKSIRTCWPGQHRGTCWSLAGIIPGKATDTKPNVMGGD